MTFPKYPRGSQDIYDFPGHGEYMACTIVHEQTVRQLMAYRALRLVLGEQAFRETLAEALDILSSSTGIHSPAAWLYWFIQQEASHAR